MGHEFAVAVVDAVAAFGDGQRDNPNLGVRQFVDQRLGAVFGQQHVADGADHPDFGVVGVAQLKQGEQVILRLQVIPGATVFGAQADAANGPVQILAGVHQGVGVIRLMRAVETADADVRDALAGVAQGVGGQDHFGGEVVQILVIQFHHRLSEFRRQRATDGSALRRRHRINGSVRRPGAGSGFRHNGSPDRHARAWSALHRKRFERGRKCRCPGVR
ncbi:hypothetical protein D3C87_1223580 [compost metagenome]